MAIKRTQLDETDEQREARETQEQAAEAQAERERQEALESEREQRRQADIRAAKAEGEAEALRRGVNAQQAPTQWNDDQWEAEGQKRGMDGRSFRTMVEMSKGISDMTVAPLKEEIAAARREAEAAKEETRQLRAKKGVESVQEDFYDKNPALKAHKKVVEEFLSTYPDADKVDGATLQKRLSIASDFVKGKVKEIMRSRQTGNTGSERMEGADERNGSDGDYEFDPKGTGNEGAAHLMSRVNRDFGRDLKYDDSIEVWKKCQDEEGRGVSIGMDEDLAVARDLAKRNIIGGKRG